ncbi:hypothetical protein VTL71DRAFT_16380 [Oculimacula yallundae]|uniref:Uncharacterized protein n=1 Tax=Oculimacula yallundae TaxID=86028 RepID=A0ABR4CFI5_9HELO
MFSHLDLPDRSANVCFPTSESSSRCLPLYHPQHPTIRPSFLSSPTSRLQNQPAMATRKKRKDERSAGVTIPVLHNLQKGNASISSRKNKVEAQKCRRLCLNHLAFRSAEDQTFVAPLSRSLPSRRSKPMSQKEMLQKGKKQTVSRTHTVVGNMQSEREKRSGLLGRARGIMVCSRKGRNF